jgi:hypothetical protein
VCACVCVCVYVCVCVDRACVCVLVPKHKGYTHVLLKDQFPSISKNVWWYTSLPTSSRSLCLPPARMHFCELTAAVSLYSAVFGSAVPGGRCGAYERVPSTHATTLETGQHKHTPRTHDKKYDTVRVAVTLTATTCGRQQASVVRSHVQKEDQRERRRRSSSPERDEREETRAGRGDKRRETREGRGRGEGRGEETGEEKGEERAKRTWSHHVPRKMGLNWFMPALANRSVGSSCGMVALDGQNVCCCA